MPQTPDTTTPQRQMQTPAISSQQERPAVGEPGPHQWTFRRWRRDLGVLLSVVALCGVTIFIFFSPSGTTGPVGGVANNANNPNQPSRTSAPTATSRAATPIPASAVSAKVVTAQTRTYSLPQPNPGVMQPVLDQHGNVWFGEMFANTLARLTPQTGAVASWAPPQGHNNIMAIAIDPHGDIWFTEQAANYIGRFNPATQRFTTYALEHVHGDSSAPQDLTFDVHGNLWFTEVNGAKIGRLTPQTGAMTTWAVPAPRAGTPAYPFCLAVTPTGEVWFGYLSGGAVGTLDSSTGAVHRYQLASNQTEVYAMNGDARGMVWFTELQGGNLGRIDTLTDSVSELPVPTTSAGSAGGMYELQVAKDGELWFASAGANALVRYAPQERAFTLYQLSIPGSVPFGLAIDSAGHVWFTASVSPNYVGVLSAP